MIGFRSLVKPLTLVLLLLGWLPGRGATDARASDAIPASTPGAGAVSPPVLGCGSVVQGSATLAADLTGCSGVGLRVAAGASLDCAGHAITGSGVMYGVLLDGATGALVSNCRVSNFSRGVRIDGGSGNTITGSELFSNLNYGLELAGATSGNSIEDNVVHDNHDEGIHVGTGAAGNMLSGNQILRSAVENLYLLSSTGNVVTGNTIAGSRSAAIYVKHTTDSTFSGNTVSDGPILVRGDSFGNSFQNNELDGTGYGFRFKAYLQPGIGWTFPHDNSVTGGSMLSKRVCFSFAGAYDNQASQVTARRCAAAVRSTLGRQRSTGDVVELIRVP